MAQSPIMDERRRAPKPLTSFPATGSGPSTRTWLILAFAFSIPLAVATFWAASNENWLVLGPILAAMGLGELAFIVMRHRD